MKNVSELEETLAFQLRAESIRDFEREYRFAHPRRFRADFYIAPDVLIECDGGVYANGRHVRGAGYEKDAEKYNLATLLGYRIFRFGPNQIKDGTALETIKRALETS